jgi:ribosomal protein S13
MVNEKKKKSNFSFFDDIYGIGPVRAKKLVEMLGLRPNTTVDF